MSWLLFIWCTKYFFYNLLSIFINPMQCNPLKDFNPQDKIRHQIFSISRQNSNNWGAISLQRREERNVQNYVGGLSRAVCLLFVFFWGERRVTDLWKPFSPLIPTKVVDPGSHWRPSAAARPGFHISVTTDISESEVCKILLHIKMLQLSLVHAFLKFWYYFKTHPGALI